MDKLKKQLDDISGALPLMVQMGSIDAAAYKTLSEALSEAKEMLPKEFDIIWKKYRVETREIEDFLTLDGKTYMTGLFDILDEKQDMSYIDPVKYEFIRGTINNVPFATFSIQKVDGGFSLSSNSRISLKNYNENSNFRLEKLGEFETVEFCKTKAQSIIEGFRTNLGSEIIVDL